MMHCRRFLVTGRVQGVFFRASTRDTARALGVTGWAKNLHDGRVEVCACGTEEQLAQMRSWLQHGPPHARVEQVTVEEIQPPVEVNATFTIK